MLALVAEAAAERARRGGRVAAAARTNTVVHTVRSRLQAAAPKRRRVAPRLMRRPTLLVAAALAHVVHVRGSVAVHTETARVRQAASLTQKVTHDAQLCRLA